jgi:hypothetical protein
MIIVPGFRLCAQISKRQAVQEPILPEQVAATSFDKEPFPEAAGATPSNIVTLDNILIAANPNAPSQARADHIIGHATTNDPAASRRCRRHSPVKATLPTVRDWIRQFDRLIGQDQFLPISPTLAPTGPALHPHDLPWRAFDDQLRLTVHTVHLQIDRRLQL